jgi:hypothetical protein
MQAINRVHTARAINFGHLGMYPMIERPPWCDSQSNDSPNKPAVLNEVFSSMYTVDVRTFI